VKCTTITYSVTLKNALQFLNYIDHEYLQLNMWLI